MNITETLAQELNLRPEYVENVISLLDEGNTIPFIARYRKEMHGSMDDQVIRQLSDRVTYLRGLEKRKEDVMHAISEQGKLTDALKKSIENADTLTAVEDLYLPFRPKRKTRASAAPCQRLGAAGNPPDCWHQAVGRRTGTGIRVHRARGKHVAGCFIRRHGHSR